jgi:ubiquinone/menaquinone biosynthesis C-methylase UbiE
MLDEIAHAGRENLDPEHVARYDAKEDADAPAEVRRLQQLGLTETSTLVDIGAGTGQLALAAAPVCAHVTALDVSPVMLARLRATIEAAGAGNIECINAGVLTYEHRGDAVDVAYSRYALHHLPDFWKAIALTRIFALLRPGGFLRLWDIVYSFEPEDAPDRLEAWCATGSEDITSEWTRPELEEHVRDEHSTFTWLLEPMIERAGFVIEEAAYTGEGIVAQYVLRKPRDAA